MIPDTADIHHNLGGQSIDQGTVEMGNHSPRLSRTDSNVQRSTRPSARKISARPFWLALLAFLFPWSADALAAEEPWIIVPEPKFMGHKVAQPIAGAKATVLAAGRPSTFGIDFPNQEEWKHAGVTDNQLLANTRTASAKWLKEIKPELVRGANKVVEYARLHSDKVPVCSAVLSPDFLRQYEDIFGPKPLIVIPNRHTVFIFPGQAGKHERFASAVLAAWHSDAPKVSLEVFEIGQTGLRAVGAFEE